MDAEYSILSFEQPGGPTVPLGVLLFDLGARQLRVQCRHDWAWLVNPDDAEVLSGISDWLVELGRESGEALLKYLQDTLSNSIQISTPQSLEATNLDDALEELYRDYVEAGTQG
jgi:hypothetical protein